MNKQKKEEKMTKKFDYQKNIITIDEAMEMLGFSNADKFVSAVDKHIPSHKINGDIDMFSISEVRSLAKSLEKELFIPDEIKERCVMFEKDIPPEKKEEPKKYVPFESKEEFIRTFDNHTTNLDIVSTEYALLRYGMWIKTIYSEKVFQVTIIEKNGIYDDGVSELINWELLLNEFTFLDGSPCGKLAEEEQ